LHENEPIYAWFQFKFQNQLTLLPTWIMMNIELAKK
jgi:hypothetical protein